jgi:uncharacterized protein
MPRVLCRFYAELNEYLPPRLRGSSFAHLLDGCPSVRDAIESLGIPPGEVELVLIDGEPSSFVRSLHDGARVSVYPVFESLDVGSLARLRRAPLRELRFVLHPELGRLATYMRVAGLDAEWHREATDDALEHASIELNRVILTRDASVLARPLITRGHLLREVKAERQLREVVDRFDLSRRLTPFCRCVGCNRPFAPGPGEAEHSPPRGTVACRCPSCGQIYRARSRRRHLERLLAELLVPVRGERPDEPLGEECRTSR